MSVIASRRRAARAGLLLAACLAGGLASAGESEAPYTRISASEFAKDPAKVAALQKAVATMRAANSATNTTAAYRGSWTYWAATHGYFGQGPNSSGPAAEFIASAPANCKGLPAAQYKTCLSYYQHVQDLALPNDGFTQNVWGMCQHSDPSGGPSQANMQFLTWHRMYLHFYERVMRKASGDPNFALPYWDYYAEKGPGGKGIALPSLVRGASTGPMYDSYRTPGLNTNLTAISAGTGSAVQAFKFTDFRNFSFQLEMQPHGAMHCGTGFGCQAPDMGIVPVAGLDPVFYMHHANIDRLWQCWLVRKSGGQPITLEWAKANLGMDPSWYTQSYTFADENGAPATLQVQDLFKPGVVDYHYDKQTDCVPASAVVMTAAESPGPAGASKPMTPMTNTAPVSLKGKARTVELRPATGLMAAPLEGVQAIAPGRTLLVIENIAIQGSPGVTYDIHIQRKGAPSKSVYIATLNYFGVLGPAHGHGTHGTPAAKSIRTLFYDVTDELAQIGASGATSADVAVTFTPSNNTLQPATVGKGAGTVTVGSIRLQAARQ